MSDTLELLPGETDIEARERHLKESVWKVVNKCANLVATIMEFCHGDKELARDFVSQNREDMISAMDDDPQLAIQVMFVIDDVFADKENF